MTAKERYQIWCEKATEDEDLVAELKKIAGSESEIKERFSTDLAFGTGGLRGVIGAGTSLMNIYTVRRATQGLADYILQHRPQGASVAIAYDSRIKSELFSREAAAVMAGNGIHAYLYPELMPTPMLSFAVRALGAQGGINVTASHNPSKYNGYKVYGADGCQLTDAAAGAVFRCIETVDLFSGVKRMTMLTSSSHAVRKMTGAAFFRRERRQRSNPLPSGRVTSSSRRSKRSRSIAAFASAKEEQTRVS